MSYLKMELLLDLTDGNKFRLREGQAADKLAALAVKIGAGAVQEVALTEAEADQLRVALTLLIGAKKQVPANA